MGNDTIYARATEITPLDAGGFALLGEALNDGDFPMAMYEGNALTVYLDAQGRQQLWIAESVAEVLGELPQEAHTVRVYWATEYWGC